jgi:hypothetical protein
MHEKETGTGTVTVKVCDIRRGSGILHKRSVGKTLATTFYLLKS